MGNFKTVCYGFHLFFNSIHLSAYHIRYLLSPHHTTYPLKYDWTWWDDYSDFNTKPIQTGELHYAGSWIVLGVFDCARQIFVVWQKPCLQTDKQNSTPNQKRKKNPEYNIEFLITRLKRTIVYGFERKRKCLIVDW